MIASLRGDVVSIGLDHAVIECAGVGYRFLATPATLATLRRGEEARVLTSLVVKEDSMTLFGFSSDDDRAMFHILQTVTGMGAKLAVAALSVFRAADLAAAIVAGEVKTLQTIPGVGKKMAERMALELKDKVAPFAPAESADAPVTPGVAPAGASTVVEQVVEALVGLGFTDKAVRATVSSLVEAQPEAETSVILRSALVELGRRK
ncbi:Holliday junction branch migration protein RuvA [Corynebacterium lizhenjunii]|uniref:Holliday junction branch migration complex subunit RuvA n=1 Tax=Corynebacterium lizhenjunii TaxID=2709394 RepID=A0A7T0P9S3_9CORY|nr:Holliday junction branch migration protein RuvA [Corynebacterium lizhenjunii]QPK78241.1 Holliday junction branch migration protein RuvA [Corynebacterium lizhenjunii]